MVNSDSLRTLFDEKIFGDFGLDATWKQKQSSDSWGESNTNSYESGSTITIVPYNTITAMMSFEEFGQLESGETQAAVRYSVNASQDDTIEFDNKVFEIQDIEKNFLQKNLINIVTLNRID